MNKAPALRPHEIPRRLTIEHFVWAALVLIFFFSIFYWIPAFHAKSAPISLALPFEKQLPYVPFMSIAYLMGYTVILPPALFFPEIVYFRRGAAALLTAMAVSGLAFVFFPVQCIPPEVTGSLDSILVKLHWLNDNGWNAFPSLHVAIATICCLTLLKVNRVVSAYSAAVWIAIFMSTILLKRHYLADSLAGLALGAICHFCIVEGEFKKRNIPWRF